MRKLSLAIADKDEYFAKSLENYLMVHYSQRFDIFSFSAPEFLAEYQNNCKKRLDILLFSPQFASQALYNADVQIALVDTDVTVPGESISICKFQHAEKLVSDIFHIYSQKYGDNFIPHGQRKVIISAVFSPAGGSGKSSIAAGCSILCARMGMKTLYLNLESIPSTSLFFKGSAGRNFSNVIYYLKEKDSNLALKLESSKCVDPESKVHYFQPPDNVLEMMELKPDDIESLISCIRSSAQYDAVFVDMADGLDPCSLSILKACDVIIGISLPGTVSSLKSEALSTAIGILEKKYSMELTGKTITVLNKYVRGSFPGDEEVDAAGSFNICIENCEGLDRSAVFRQPTDMGNTFYSGIDNLLEMVLPDWKEIRLKLHGGAAHV